MGCASSTNCQGFHDKYSWGDKLGSGTFADVRTCMKKSASKELAVKIIPLARSDSPDTTNVVKCQQAATEIHLWKSVGKHKHCVRLHEVFFGTANCYVVMEKCDHALFQYLERMPELTESSLGNVLAQALSAISHVHSAKVVHRDIKPENLLVGGSDGDTVKLCDFGLSAMLPKQGKLFGVVGTAPYMCPEMLANRAYDEKADVWSLGVLSYTLLFGHFPHRPKQRQFEALKQAIVNGKEPTFEVAVHADMDAISDHDKMRSESVVGFVRSLMQRIPDSRPSAKEALKMTYMTAVMSQSHTPKVDLPSLKPMLASAQYEHVGDHGTLQGGGTVVTEGRMDMMALDWQFSESPRSLARGRSHAQPDKQKEPHQGNIIHRQGISDITDIFASISTCAIEDTNSLDTAGSTATSLSV